MSKNINLSVIIPVYNAESYINGCLESVMEQQGASFEVVLVNDGSIDSTGEICRLWADSYYNIVYLEQENQGQGTARNVAIDHASGEWLVFLDADDIMLPGALKYLERVASEEIDIFVYGCIFISENQERAWTQLPPSANDKKIIMKEIMSVLWDKMFRTAFWKQNGLRLMNIYGEDVCPVYLLEAQAENIRTLQLPLMCHYERSDNLSSKPGQILQIVQTLEDTLNIFDKKGIFKMHQIPLFFMLLNHHKHYYRLWRRNHQNVERQITAELEKLAVQYFPEKYWKLFEAEKEALVIIGKIDRPFPAELEARDTYYYQCLEQYLIDENKVTNTRCHFIVNVENEIQSVAEGTRTLNWALSYWNMQCAEMMEIRKKKRLKGDIFLYRADEDRNEIVESFEKVAISRWACERLAILEDFWKYVDQGESSYGKPEKNDIAVSGHEKKTLIKDFNYRREYLRLDYNVRVLCSWLRLTQHGISLETYFREHRYCSVGIYGIGYLGKLLLSELESSSVKISFLVDSNDRQESKYKIYDSESILPAVDVIVVSVIHQYDWIRMQMKCVCSVVSLQEIVKWCENRRISGENSAK